MNNQRSIFFSHAEPSRFGGAGRVERKSFFSALSNVSKAFLLVVGFAVVCTNLWAQRTPIDFSSSNSSNTTTVIKIPTARSGEYKFTLAPEDKSRTHRSHWPVIFIDYENNGKNIREMINLREETEFTVNATGSEIHITGDLGVWKLVAVGQGLKAFPSWATDLRYLNVNDNEITTHAIWISNNAYTLETFYAERNKLVNDFHFSQNVGQQNFDNLRRISLMENQINRVFFSPVTNAMQVNFSKNLITSMVAPTTMETADFQAFKGGDADTYENHPELLYETIGVNDVKFDFSVNRMNIATLPKMPVSKTPSLPFTPDKYIYTLQERFKLAKFTYKLYSETIDISSQAKALGVTDDTKWTNFRWFREVDAATDNYELIPEDYYRQTAPGRFVFMRSLGKTTKIFAAMTTDAWPHPLESFEREATSDYSSQWGYTGVLKQPEGTPSLDRNVYMNDLPNNTIGDGTTRTLSDRFYRTNTITLDAAEKNYWYGFESNEWGNPRNWTGGYVPPTEWTDPSNSNANVEFASVSNYSKPAIRDLHTDCDRQAYWYINGSETGKALIVQPGHRLRVHSTRQAPATFGPYSGVRDVSYRTVLRAEEGKPNAAFYFYGAYYLHATSSMGTIIANSNNYPLTVEMFSKAFDGNRDKQNATWQYFGLPFATPTKYSEQFPETAWVRRYNRTKNDEGDEKWEEVSGSAELQRGAAYEITQPTPTLYRFKGQMTRAEQNYQVVSSTSPRNYSDMHIYANPHTYPVPINQDAIAWPSQAFATLYLYNTGSRKNWENNAGGTTNSDSPGAYTVAIPIGVEGRLPEMPTQIPTLSAFMVRGRNTPNSMGQLTLRYNFNHMDTPTEENRSQGMLPSILMKVESEATTDALWLAEAPEATEGYDDGLDGEKLFTSGHAQIYALEDKDYQVSTKSQLTHTDLAFVPGDDAGQYTLNFTLTEALAGRQFYLFDHITGESIAVYDGMRYDFSAKMGDPLQRFAITTDPTAVKELTKTANFDVKVDHHRNVIVRNHTDEAAEVKVFDVSGKAVANFSVSADSEDRETLFTPGVYVIHVNNAQAQVTQRYVVH